MKNINSFLIVVALFFTLVFSSCSDGQTVVAGIPGAGTEAGETHGQIVASNGIGIISARINIYQKTTPISELILIDSLVTDENGYFSYQNKVGTYHFAIQSSEGVAWLPEIVVRNNIETDTIKTIVTPAVTVKGTLIEANGAIANNLYLAGTPFSCLTTPNVGSVNFTCTGIPVGKYGLIEDGYWVGEFDVDSTDSVLILDTIKYQRDVILLEDWKNDNSTHLLNSIIDSSHWALESGCCEYYVPSSVDSIQRYSCCEYYVPSTVDSVQQSFLYDSIADINYLRTEYNDSTILRLNLHIGNGSYNFESFDSLCFNFRNDSPITISLSDYEPDFDVVQFHTFGPNEDWNRSCVTRDQLQTKSYLNSIPTETFIQNIDVIRIAVQTGTYFEVGDVELIGLDLEDAFIKQK